MRRSIADTIRAVNLAATVACVIVAATAEAHPEFAPSTVNRYIKVDLVAADELRVAYTVMVGTAPAAAWRRAADANADGKIDDAESRAIGERARAAVAAGLSLRVDGKSVTPAWESPSVGLAGNEVAPSPLSVDLVARVPLGGAPSHVVRLDDATPEPQLGETEVRIEESPVTRLVRAHRGPIGDEKQTRFLFRGPKFSALEDRSITFELTGAAPSGAAHGTPASTPRRRGRLVYYLAIALASALVGVMVRMRQRRMKG
ncbi:MAG: hypothetical protein JWN44_531 [Myxococcales bacterium]|nr:hypothetical protein [Myxococcales bacterium]